MCFHHLGALLYGYCVKLQYCLDFASVMNRTLQTVLSRFYTFKSNNFANFECRATFDTLNYPSAPLMRRRMPQQSPPYTGLKLGGYEQHQKNLKAQANLEYRQFLEKQVHIWGRNLDRFMSRMYCMYITSCINKTC